MWITRKEQRAIHISPAQYNWGGKMGRPRFYRQNIIKQVQSVSQKSLLGWLINETEKRFGISPEEARLVALKGVDYLNKASGVRQITMELIDIAFAGHRNKLSELPQRSVILTPVSIDDLEIHQQLGLKAMQNARLIRLIEETYHQGGH